MSIRIGILDENVFKSVYVYNSSQPAKLALTIRQHYKKRDIVDELIALGDISSISKTIKESRYFCRDKGDPWEACVPYDETAASLEDIDIQSSPVDFYFAYFKNKWYVSPSYQENKWITITKFINSFKK